MVIISYGPVTVSTEITPSIGRRAVETSLTLPTSVSIRTKALAATELTPLYYF
jgi:hypothetical protein